MMGKLDQGDFARVLAKMGSLDQERYLHWDELRRRRPPDGLSEEEWWLGTHMLRTAISRLLPLYDKGGHPFRFNVPNEAQIHLHHIDRDAAGSIEAVSGAPTVQSQQQYLRSSLIEEAITSSQLEGASTTRRVAQAMLREERKPRDHSEQMIFNNHLAMSYIREKRPDKLTPEFVLELHRMLTVGTLADPQDEGRLRRADDVQVVDNRDGTILHQPSGWVSLPERLQILCDFANQTELTGAFLHPVLRAILLHFMIGYDHPFVDGNGRVARALFYWAMARDGYWLMEYVSISHILRKAPSQYVRAYLYTETDNNDTTYFLLHQLATIRRAIEALHDYLSRKGQEQKETERMLASHALRGRFNHRQIALLGHALRNPEEPFRVDVHQQSHSVVYQTARSDLIGLVDIGLLERVVQGKVHLFYPVSDLQMRLKGLGLLAAAG
ncbi:Fic family protein [Andreprevotia lacus]|jgi:Fic family protein|nr:Fic family protein [Andreprevotia lacus]